jgi:hypothetical protein
MYKVKHSNKITTQGPLFQMALLFGVLLFQPSCNLFANSDESFPTVISYASMTKRARAEAGFVAAVDSGKLSGEKSWSYTLKEAGDYQLGTAWIEALSEGEVEVVISINGKVVKTVTASKDNSKKPGRSERDFGLFRLESRFEGLAADSRVEIKAVPVGDLSYRLAYHLVFTTPTFEGLKVFNIADFGARADGVHDDMSAIHKAVDAAKAAGGGIIRFEKEKTYRVVGRDDLEYEAVFDLVDTANIKIEGQGSTFVLQAPDGLANIRQARNIQIDGLLVDYDPLPYYQGKITNINVENMTIDIVVPERYPVPLTGKSESKAPFFGRSFIPWRPGARSGSGNNIYIESVTALKDNRHLRLQVPKFAKGSDTPNAANKTRVINAKKRGATEFVVPHMTYGHLKGYTNILQSARVKFSNIRYYLVPYFFMKVKGNTGPVSFQNVDLKMKHPETELYASWRDGYHIKNGRFGTLIDGSDIDGAAQYDDTFAIYTRIHNVAAIDMKNKKLSLDAAFRGHKDLHTWLKGDWVSIWNKNQTQLRGMARVIEAQDVPESEKRFYLRLEDLPSRIQRGDVVINEEVLNRGTLIRNCSTSSTGTEDASNRFRASGIRFENNRFEDFNFHVEFNPFWGTPRSRDVLVKGCYFGGGESAVQLFWPIGMVFEKCRFDRLASRGAHNAVDIVLKDAEWLNAGRIIYAGPGSTMYLEGDIRVNGKTVSPEGSEIKKRIFIAKGAAVQLPDGRVLENTPTVRKPAVKHPTVTEKITGGVIVTIKDPGYKETGVWADSGLSGYQGGKSRFSDKGGSAVFSSPLKKAGTYKVYIYRVTHPSNDARQGIVINHGSGSENLVVDMRTGPSGWVELGSYAFKRTKEEGVVVKPGSGISQARCSAVMFVQYKSK